MKSGICSEAGADFSGWIQFPALKEVTRPIECAWPELCLTVGVFAAGKEFEGPYEAASYSRECGGRGQLLIDAPEESVHNKERGRRGGFPPNDLPLTGESGPAEPELTSPQGPRTLKGPVLVQPP